VGFYRPLRNAQLGRDDLVGRAARDVGRDFAFAVGQTAEQRVGQVQADEIF
jgi:hypothetical protein